MNNAFWKFSINVYTAPGVADECLALQNKFGVDVNVLLFVAYVGTRQLIMSIDELHQCTDLVRDWHEQITKQLRHVRTTLKSMSLRLEPVGGQKQHFRDAVKAIELESERVEQDMLYRWFEMQTLLRAGQGMEEAIRKNIATLFSLNTALGAQALPSQMIRAAHTYALDHPA